MPISSEVILIYSEEKRIYSEEIGFSPEETKKQGKNGAFLA